MNNLPLNEKLIETMFNGMLLRQFGAEISLFTPTTRQERTMGFDTKLKSGPVHHDLLLQFKLAMVNKEDIFSFNVTPHQHSILQKEGQGRAYYLAPTFRCACEISKAQEKSEHNSYVFFRHYIAINVQELPSDVKNIQFRRQILPSSAISRLDPLEPKYRTENGAIPYEISPAHWMTADKLIYSIAEKSHYTDAISLPDFADSEPMYAGTGVGLEAKVASVSRHSLPPALTFVQWRRA